MKWFRFYDEVLDDQKVQSLSPARFKQWVNLVCLANRQSPRGTIPPIEKVAFGLRQATGNTQAMLDDFLERGLIETEEGVTKIHNWKGRQFDSDTSSERMRRHRGVTSDGTVTVSVTPPDTDTDSDTEQIQIQKKHQAVTRLPDRYLLNPTLYIRWRSTFSGVDVDREISSAFEWESAHPSRRKKNLQAFLSAWLRRASDRVPKPAPIPEKVRPPILDETERVTEMPPEIRAQLESLVAGKRMP